MLEMLKNKQNVINVCLACDNNYAQYAGVVIASVLANSDENEVLNFYILENGVSSENKEKIRSLTSIKNCSIFFVSPNNEMFSDYLAIKTHDYISLPTYYRLKLPTILQDVSRVIYLDCDVIVNHSLSELFNTELGDCPVAGVRDINKKAIKKNPSYVNAGVLVMDIENLRKFNAEQKFLTWTIENKSSIKLGDQEIINEVLKGCIKIVPDEWNVQSSNFTNRSSYTNAPKIVHFVARKKPWHYASFSYHKNLYFKYLQLTPWQLDDTEYKHWTKDNQRESIIAYLKYRPFILFRPRFYKALFYTYVIPLIRGELNK